MLDWPPETVMEKNAVQPWYQAGSNQVLDFHGDPLKAELVVFSDGNHHMALRDALKAFYQRHPRLSDIFYATTPPYPIVKLLQEGAIRIGNLTLSVQPHVFIGPPHVLDRLQILGHIKSHVGLAKNQGSVLLIPRDNPKNIRALQDLMRRDVRLFISNPETERTSYNGYRTTLESMVGSQGLNLDAFCAAVFDRTAVYGQCIHHREAPEAIANGQADVAIVYYHLAMRYKRLFPDQFDMIPLGGSEQNPIPPLENLTNRIHMGLVGNGGTWGEPFMTFMQGDSVGHIYEHHGLIPIVNEF